MIYDIGNQRKQWMNSHDNSPYDPWEHVT